MKSLIKTIIVSVTLIGSMSAIAGDYEPQVKEDKNITAYDLILNSKKKKPKEIRI